MASIHTVLDAVIENGTSGKRVQIEVADSLRSGQITRKYCKQSQRTLIPSLLALFVLTSCKPLLLLAALLATTWENHVEKWRSPTTSLSSIQPPTQTQ
jgi:hypothetical protein